MVHKPLIPQLLTSCFVVLTLWFFWQFYLGLADPIVHLKSKDLLFQNASKPKSLPKFNTSFFGEYVPKDLSQGGLPESLIDMEVVGVLYADNEQDSQVILKKSNGDEKTYHVGDEIAEGVVIKRITEHAVMLLRDGVLEHLSLPQNKLKFDPLPKPLKEES